METTPAPTPFPSPSPETPETSHPEIPDNSTMEEPTETPQPEAAAATEEAPAPEKPKKIGGMTDRTRNAVIEYMELHRKGVPTTYAKVAKKHGVKMSSLRTAVFKVRKGTVSLGRPEDPVHVALDRRLQSQEMNRALDEYAQVLIFALQGKVKLAKEFQLKGKLLAYRDMGIPLIVQDIRALTTLQTVAKKGLVEVLSALNKEKEIKDAVADVPGERVEREQEHLDAHEAIRLKLEAMRETAVDGEIVAAEDREE
jgi:hypothetical protein